jgi:hypothetical protein
MKRFLEKLPAVCGCALGALTTPVIVAMTLFWLFGGPVRYDRKTAKLARHLEKLTTEQWREVYLHSGKVFLASNREDRRNSRELGESELPALLRGLGFAYCHLTEAGVAYERKGGGWNLNATRVWSVHSPLEGTGYDRLGIWFDGFQFEDYIYKVNPKPVEEPRTKEAQPAGIPLQELDPRLLEFIHPTTQ